MFISNQFNCEKLSLSNFNVLWCHTNKQLFCAISLKQSKQIEIFLLFYLNNGNNNNSCRFGV